MNMPQAKQRIEAAGYEIAGSTPGELDAFIKAEIARWARVVKDSGATVNQGAGRGGRRETRFSRPLIAARPSNVFLTRH